MAHHDRPGRCDAGRLRHRRPQPSVDKRGHEVARLRRGGGFGEISLIRDVPCTATVTATADSLMYALEKDRFILAVTGHQPAATAADRLIDRRLKELEADAAE